MQWHSAMTTPVLVPRTTATWCGWLRSAWLLAATLGRISSLNRSKTTWMSRALCPYSSTVPPTSTVKCCALVRGPGTNFANSPSSLGREDIFRHLQCCARAWGDGIFKSVRTDRSVTLRAAAARGWCVAAGHSDSPLADVPLVTCQFLTGGRVLSVYAKRARGLMVRHIVVRPPRTPSGGPPRTQQTLPVSTPYPSSQ